MDLTSESHYKEYGLFTYIEARKLPKVESRPKRNEKRSNHSVGVAVHSCVWFEILQTSWYLCFSNCVNGSVTTESKGIFPNQRNI